MEVTLAPPKEMGGSGEGANPEQLFALGYSGCFHSALKVVGAQRKSDMSGSTVEASVTIGKGDGGYRLAVVLAVHVPAVSHSEAEEMVAAAHQLCPYSAAVRGNVPVELRVLD
jgi:Ohr subfamily peroxiredoxin